MSNLRNKDLLIKRLQNIFTGYGIESIQANEDADIQIVTLAPEKANEYEAVQIIGDDTDLLILLTQFGAEISNVYLTKYHKTKSSMSNYNSDCFKYPNLKKKIAFAHAMCGCDTTSAFAYKGKEKIFKVLEGDETLSHRVEAFYHPDANPDDLWQIALKILSVNCTRTR